MQAASFREGGVSSEVARRYAGVPPNSAVKIC